jgi:DNA polymerase IIIc chi subunit
METNFYAIYENNLHRVLISLLEKTLKVKHNAIILCESIEEAKKLDEQLWTSASWLPHCFFEDYEQMKTPIIIYDNNSFDNNLVFENTFLFLLNNTETDLLENIKKIYLLFDAQKEEKLSYNRIRWQNYKKLNYSMNFYKQLKNGKFEEQKF